MVSCVERKHGVRHMMLVWPTLRNEIPEELPSNGEKRGSPHQSEMVKKVGTCDAVRGGEGAVASYLKRSWSDAAVARGCRCCCSGKYEIGKTLGEGTFGK
jgi:hypothetical protein